MSPCWDTEAWDFWIACSTASTVATAAILDQTVCAGRMAPCRQSLLLIVWLLGMKNKDCAAWIGRYRRVSFVGFSAA